MGKTKTDRKSQRVTMNRRVNPAEQEKRKVGLISFSNCDRLLKAQEVEVEEDEVEEEEEEE